MKAGAVMRVERIECVTEHEVLENRLQSVGFDQVASIKSAQTYARRASAA
jgi:hypothetical protein